MPATPTLGVDPAAGLAGEAAGGGGLDALCDTLAAWVRKPPAVPPAWPETRWERCRLVSQTLGVAPLLGRRLEWAAAPARPEAAETPEAPATAHTPQTAETAATWATAESSATSANTGWFAAQYRANRRRVAKLHEELREVLACFAAAEVPLVPLKGALLGVVAYRDPAERPMADLDFLLRPGDLGRAAELLAGLGYEKIWTGWKHTRFARPDNREIVDPSCEHPDNPRVLELHPLCREKIGDQMVDLTASIWAAARPGELLGAAAWILEPAVCWLQLAVHATHHILINRFRLIQLVDLVLVGAAGAAGAPADDPGGFAPRLGDLLAGIDGRATYAPLALLRRYFPEEGTAALLGGVRARLSPGFAEWADALDLFHASYLDPAPWREP